MMEAARCPWCGNDTLYIRYHDEEWGQPVTDDRTLFEFLTLESAQAGLAWITILRKREGYRMAFHDFDYRKVALMTEEDEKRLRQFDGIVRNRRKIHAAIVNAQLFGEIVEVSDAISKDMRRRGFSFFGTTICYSFLQATGFIDDHLNGCPCKTNPHPSEPIP